MGGGREGRGVKERRVCGRFEVSGEGRGEPGAARGVVGVRNGAKTLPGRSNALRPPPWVAGDGGRSGAREAGAGGSSQRGQVGAGPGRRRGGGGRGPRPVRPRLSAATVLARRTLKDKVEEGGGGVGESTGGGGSERGRRVSTRG